MECLCTKDQDLQTDHGDRQRGFDDGRHARAHILFAPEQWPVGQREHQQSDQSQITPLAQRGSRCSAQSHETVQKCAGYEETYTRREQRWRCEHGDSNRQEGSAPQQVDGAESQPFA